MPDHQTPSPEPTVGTVAVGFTSDDAAAFARQRMVELTLREHLWADRPGQTCGCGWEASSAWMVDRDQPNRVEQHLTHVAAEVLAALSAVTVFGPVPAHA